MQAYPVRASQKCALSGRRRLLRWSHMDKRYTVFVSSTFRDMVEERNAVIQAIMRQGHIPLGMEAFGAANAGSWRVITKTIDAADYYVLIIAKRYGSINTELDLGYTEMEYRYAVERGVPVLAFLLDDSAPWPGNRSEEEADAIQRLKAFRQSVSSNLQVDFWQSQADLPAKVMTALGNAFSDDPRSGWVRPSPVAGPGVAEAMALLTEENARLRATALQNSTYGGSEVDQAIRALESRNYSLVNVCLLLGEEEIYFEFDLLTLFNILSSWIIKKELTRDISFATRLTDSIRVLGGLVGKGKAILKPDYYQIEDSLYKLRKLGLIVSNKLPSKDFILTQNNYITPLGDKVYIETELRGDNHKILRLPEEPAAF